MDRSMRILHLIQVGSRVYRWWLLVHGRELVRVINVMRISIFSILHSRLLLWLLGTDVCSPPVFGSGDCCLGLLLACSLTPLNLCSREILFSNSTSVLGCLLKSLRLHRIPLLTLICTSFIPYLCIQVCPQSLPAQGQFV